MSPVKPVDTTTEYLYFVTTTTANHVRLFKSDVVKRIIVDSLNHMRVIGWVNLYAFVILPNHIHFIIRLAGEKLLAEIIRDFKKYTARQIIHHYQVFDEPKNLLKMEKAAGKTGQVYKVWENGFDAREIFTAKFLSQKMEYIHHNPCQPHWKLADLPEEYPWSSARFYLLDQAALIDLDDVREIFV